MLFPVLDYFGRTFGPNEFGSAVRSVSNNWFFFFFFIFRLMLWPASTWIPWLYSSRYEVIFFFFLLRHCFFLRVYVHSLPVYADWTGVLEETRSTLTLPSVSMISIWLQSSGATASVKGSKDKLTSGSNASPMVNSFFTFWGTFLLWILAMRCIGYGHGEEYLL